MSTIQKVNFEPLSDMLVQVSVRDFVLADPTIADPRNAVALVDGEWLSLNSSYQALRASDVATPAAAAAAISWPVWAERGRSDVQALRQAPVLYLGQYEADTRVFNAASMVLGGRVSVATVTLGGRNYSGLVANGSVGTPGAGITVGFITRLPTNNGGKLRIRGGILF